MTNDYDPEDAPGYGADECSSEHVKIEDKPPGYRMFCEHCGQSGIAMPPFSFDMFLLIMGQFEKEHRHCERPIEQEAT